MSCDSCIVVSYHLLSRKMLNLFFILRHYHMSYRRWFQKCYMSLQKQLISDMGKSWCSSYLLKFSFVFLSRWWSYILWRVAYCCLPTIHQRCKLCNESIFCGYLFPGGYLVNAKRCFSAKFWIFTLLFYVKKNSIFDWNSRVEEKKCFFLKLLFQKHRFYW